MCVVRQYPGGKTPLFVRPARPSSSWLCENSFAWASILPDVGTRHRIDARAGWEDFITHAGRSSEGSTIALLAAGISVLVEAILEADARRREPAASSAAAAAGVPGSWGGNVYEDEYEEEYEDEDAGEDDDDDQDEDEDDDEAEDEAEDDDDDEDDGEEEDDDEDDCCSCVTSAAPPRAVELRRDDAFFQLADGKKWRRVFAKLNWAEAGVDDCDEARARRRSARAPLPPVASVLPHVLVPRVAYPPTPSWLHPQGAWPSTPPWLHFTLAPGWLQCTALRGGARQPRRNRRAGATRR